MSRSKRPSGLLSAPRPLRTRVVWRRSGGSLAGCFRFISRLDQVQSDPPPKKWTRSVSRRHCLVFGRSRLFRGLLFECPCHVFADEFGFVVTARFQRVDHLATVFGIAEGRSEERRVGKDW